MTESDERNLFKNQRAIAARAASRAPWGSAWAAQSAQWSPQEVTRDRKTLRMATLAHGFRLSATNG